MYSRRNLTILSFLAILMLLAGSTVLADDGRINRAPWHFGGDTLYCNQIDGCTLLNKTGVELANWPQSVIATAFATYDKSKQNTQVEGDALGTYGAFQLWAVGAEDIAAHKLCLMGYDEWGKPNSMCFVVHTDNVYDQAPVATGSDYCEVSLPSKAHSFDGIHKGGWDVWTQYPGGSFLYWSESDPGYAACKLVLVG